MGERRRLKEERERGRETKRREIDKLNLYYCRQQGGETTQTMIREKKKEEKRDLILQKTHNASYARKIADRSFEDKRTGERIG